MSDRPFEDCYYYTADLLWRPAHLELPPEETTVLIVYRNRDGGQRLTFAIHAGGEWRFIRKGEKTCRPDRVEHWSELPELPTPLRKWARRKRKGSPVLVIGAQGGEDG